MTQVEEFIKHHGVKGMKWGQKKYKEIRKTGVKEIKNLDKAYTTSQRDGRKASRALGKAGKALAKSDRTGSAKDKAKSEKLVKDWGSKHNKAITSSRLTATQTKKVDRIISKASKLPVTIHRSESKRRAKKFIKTWFELSGMVPPKSVTQDSNKDRFDDTVDAKQRIRK